jgi:hypothetical protein
MFLQSAMQTSSTGNMACVLKLTMADGHVWTERGSAVAIIPLNSTPAVRASLAGTAMHTSTAATAQLKRAMHFALIRDTMPKVQQGPCQLYQVLSMLPQQLPFRQIHILSTEPTS